MCSSTYLISTFLDKALHLHWFTAQSFATVLELLLSIELAYPRIGCLDYDWHVVQDYTLL
jgi:hypothetical protein